MSTDLALSDSTARSSTFCKAAPRAKSGSSCRPHGSRRQSVRSWSSPSACRYPPTSGQHVLANRCAQAAYASFITDFDPALVPNSCRTRSFRCPLAKREACTVPMAPFLQPQVHDRAVVGVQHVLSDLVARRLVEGRQPAGDVCRKESRGKGRIVEDMDTHVTQDAQRPMRRGQTPEPLAFLVPRTPGGLGQPRFAGRTLRSGAPLRWRPQRPSSPRR